MNRIGRARNARINQARKFHEEVGTALLELTGHTMHEHIDCKDAWADCRNALEQLLQCFHEASAYNNAMAPQGGEASAPTTDERVQPRSGGRRTSAALEPPMAHQTKPDNRSPAR